MDSCLLTSGQLLQQPGCAPCSGSSGAEGAEINTDNELQTLVSCHKRRQSPACSPGGAVPPAALRRKPLASKGSVAWQEHGKPSQPEQWVQEITLVIPNRAIVSQAAEQLQSQSVWSVFPGVWMCFAPGWVQERSPCPDCFVSLAQGML